MKVKVTLEVEVRDDADDRGSIDIDVDTALHDIGRGIQEDSDYYWSKHKIAWEPLT